MCTASHCNDWPGRLPRRALETISITCWDTDPAVVLFYTILFPLSLGHSSEHQHVIVSISKKVSSIPYLLHLVTSGFNAPHWSKKFLEGAVYTGSPSFLVSFDPSLSWHLHPISTPNSTKPPLAMSLIITVLPDLIHFTEHTHFNWSIHRGDLLSPLGFQVLLIPPGLTLSLLAASFSFTDPWTLEDIKAQSSDYFFILTKQSQSKGLCADEW